MGDRVICALLLELIVPDSALRMPSPLERTSIFHDRLEIEAAANAHLEAKLRHILDR